jgi:tetratricopeptide (TPR) repeat protein
LRKAHELLPQRADVTFNLAIVLARLGRRDEAEHLIEGALSRQADEETILKAREGLLHVDLQVADEFLREGDFEGGLEVLEEVISQTSDSELFAQLSDKVDEVRTYLVSAEHQRLFEEAIDLAQDSRYDEAIERFETILSESRDPELRSATKENLKRMKRLR